MNSRFAAPLLGCVMGLGLCFASPVAAKVVKADDGGFVTRDTAVVEATPKEVWLALISPGKWWNSAHTWSGDSANMMIRPQAGGCFCERIPENPDPEKITLEGSVEHMRVIQAFPEKVLRMSGGLGPLQSEAATGTLTIVMGEREEGGTQIVWEYVVGGYMRYEVPVIAKAVDGVMSQQLQGLVTLLGGGEIEDADEDATEEDAGSAPTIEPEELGGEDEEAAEGETSEDRMSALEEAVEALEDN